MTDLPRPTTATAAQVLEAAASCAARGVRGAMATVLERHGSAPGTAGQKLYLAADGTCLGTVGGGAIEHATLEALQAIVADPLAKHAVREFKLGTELGMCCGGRVEMLVEPIAGIVPCLIVGGGHVATAVAPLLVKVGFAVTVIDDREGWGDEERLAGVRCVSGEYDELGDAVDVRGACLVMTHDHSLDQRAIEWALSRGFAFVGGVGSRAKAERTRQRLEAKGVPEADRARVRMPLGVQALCHPASNPPRPSRCETTTLVQCHFAGRMGPEDRCAIDPRCRAYPSGNMRATRLLTAVFVVPAVIAAACAGPDPKVTTGGPSLPPRDASAEASLASRRCTPWVDPAELASTPPDPPPDPDDANRDRHTKPQNAKDVCYVADSNLARAEAAIVASPGGPMAAHVAWDHKQPPARLDLVDRRFALTKRERSLLTTNGFVVMSRRGYSTFAWGLHDVFQSQLPIYVSADAILHAVYASNDHLLAQIESTLLVPLLGRSLSAMHCALAEAASSYPQEVARDLDVYLTVARSLLADAPVPSVLGADAEAAARVADAKKASGIANVELFGRARLIDWSQYEPRGHYAGPAPAQETDNDGNPIDSSSGSAAEPGDEPSLSAYFRAAMWLSRIEMNLVSRSSRSSSPSPTPDPRETPREAIAAVALADLIDRAHAVDDVARLDRAWGLLAGRREDVTMSEILKLRQKAGFAKIELASFDKLKSAIGSDYQRTARLHPMPEGSTVLPAIATLLGPRVVADTAAFRPLVNSEVGGRYLVSSGDVAYVLGLDRGKTYLADDLSKFPDLASHLDVARGVIKAAPDAGDLYGAWLSALRGVAAAPSGVVPTFMTTPAYADLRMNTLVAGYGQIRHNYVLMAGQSYDEGGCEIPDGWVEPLPGVYDGIASYASRGVTALRELDPKDRTGSIAYFTRLGKIARVLGTIAKHELEGRALTEEEKRFLAMVVEMTPGSSGGGPTYTGWYFDLFRGRWEEGLATSAFTADYHTSSYLNKVVYAGATGPRMGIFVVDAGGPPRVMVGPVARAYELVGSTEKRFNDATGVTAKDKRDPWAASYTADTPAAPAFALAASVPYDKKIAKVVLRAGAVALPRVIIEAIDHHSVAVATETRAVPANGRIYVSMPTSRLPEGIRVRIGDYSWDELSHGPGEGGVSIETTADVKIDEKDWAALTK